MAALFTLGVVGILLSSYLAYADLPRRSDVIVLFLGGQDSRFQEVQQLLREGYSEFMFIPDSFSFYQTLPGGGGIASIRLDDLNPEIHLPGPRPEQETEVYFRKNWAAYGFPRFYEATHVEMLLAKKAMDACGFKKAIFVSSPYHMHRIKIMANRVFDSSYELRLVPSRYEGGLTTLLSPRENWNALTEVPKMIWFYCYDLMGSTAGRSIDKKTVSPILFLREMKTASGT
jgi:hypothetical protein